jgi:aryl carrier-like protein
MGARWHVYRKVLVGENELLAFLELPEEFTPELQQLKLYPTLLDRGVALAKRFLAAPASYVPVSYRRLCIRAPLERKTYIHIRLHPDSEKLQETISFDVVLMNEEGEELVAIEEFSEKRIDIGISKRVLGNGHERQESSPPENLSDVPGVVASVYAASLQRGITPKEGQEAFRYILSAVELPQIIVSTTSLNASIAEARNSAALKRIAEKTSDMLLSHRLHPRPAMQTPYLAPRNEFETKISESWRRVLGVAEIGIHDNYFDLGGDSVQAIQIIAQMNRQGFRLTPQQLFQHQTVAEVAKVVAGSQSIPQKIPEVASNQTPSDFPLAGLNEEELKELEKFLEETDKSHPG